MDKKAVAEICRVLKVDLLDDYRKAVYRNNVAEVKRMRPESLNTAWDNGYLKRVLFDEGHLATTTQNILPVYQKKPGRGLLSTPWLRILSITLANCP
ncbi:MAG TPA: hypothetical protein PKW06_02350 [Cyclobacteriaceae bacterium]|nr:hypothetical protein [Cyclobacteriaceae bacterium]